MKTKAERRQRVAAWFGVACLGLLPLGPLSGQEPKPRATFKGHTEPVLSVAYSPDGKTLASAGGRYEGPSDVKLWDVATGKEQATLQGHTGYVWFLAYSPDGQTLASASKDTTVKLWDVRTGKEQATLKGHSDWRSSVAFSPDGKTLAAGSKDRTIKLWDVKTTKLRATLKWRLGWLAEQVAPIPKQEVAVAYSPDGKTLASGNVDGTIKLWDVAMGKEQATLKGNYAVILVAFSPDGETLASTAGSQIRLWDVKTAKERATLWGHTQVNSLAFSPDGKTLASASADTTIKLWNVATGKEEATLKGHTGVWSVAYSPDGKTLASGNQDKTVKLWDVPAAKELDAGRKEAKADNKDRESLQGDWRIDSFEEKGVTSPGDGTHTLTFTANKIHQFDKGPKGADFQYSFKLDSTKNPAEIDMTILHAGKEKDKAEVGKTVLGIYKLDGDNLKLCIDPTVRPTTFHMQGKRRETVLLVLKRQEGWEQLDGAWELVSTEKDGKQVRPAVQFNPQLVPVFPTYTFTFNGYGWVLRDHRDNGELRGTFRIIKPAAEIKGIDLLQKNGKTISSIYRIEGKTLKYCTSNTPGKRPTEFATKGGWTFSIWKQTSAGVIIKQDEPMGRFFRGHKGHILSVAFSPDGKRLASTGYDQMVKVWDLEKVWNRENVWNRDSDQVLNLTGHGGGAVADVAFSPDSKLLASAGAGDGLVKLWNSITGKEVFSLRGHTTSVYGVAFSPDGKHLASGSGDQTVKVWDVASGKAVRTLKGPGMGLVYRVAYSRDGKFLASGGDVCKVWDAKSGEEIHSLGKAALLVAFSPDSQRLATASGPTVSVWDVASGREKLTFRAQSKVWGLAYSPNGKWLASAGDLTVKIWEAATGKENVSHKAHTDMVRCVVFSPDGHQFLSGSNDLTMCLLGWAPNAPKANLKEPACKTATKAVGTEVKEENEAEKLFRGMEKNVRNAKTLQLRFDVSVIERERGTAKGILLLGGGDKLRVEAEGRLFGEAIKFIRVSDGANMKSMGYSGGPAPELKGIGVYFRSALPREGYFSSSLAAHRHVDQAPPELSGFKLAGVEKLGKRNMKVIQYKVKANDDTDPLTAKMWLDAQTHLPAKLVLIRTGTKGDWAEVTETYSEFTIDAKVDAKLFELPKVLLPPTRGDSP